MHDVRHTIGAMLDTAMRKRSHPFDVADWQASAVIIAPHPDDETLGCGGVASKKFSSGADIRFIFVADGSASPTTRRRGREPTFALRPLTRGSRSPISTATACLNLQPRPGMQKEVAWWRNPGDGSADWQRHDVANVPNMVYPERVAVADLTATGEPTSS